MTSDQAAFDENSSLRILLALNAFPINCFVLFFSFFHSTEIEPSFESRNVAIKKGEDAKEYYDLLTEIGR